MWTATKHGAVFDQRVRAASRHRRQHSLALARRYRFRAHSWSFPRRFRLGSLPYDWIRLRS